MTELIRKVRPLEMKMSNSQESDSVIEPPRSYGRGEECELGTKSSLYETSNQKTNWVISRRQRVREVKKVKLLSYFFSVS